MWLRTLIGLSFFPMTLMNVSYAVIGSVVAPHVFWDRVYIIAIIYVLGLGLSAHALDAVFSRKSKPWGNYLSNRVLLVIAISSLIPAIAIGIYYAVTVVPLLWVFGLAEIFFLFAYNMEIGGGKFHTDAWFAFSWGSLPLLTGYVMQTNTLSLIPLILAIFAFLTSLIEIKASRPYKNIRKGIQLEKYGQVDANYERILQSVVAAVTVLMTVLVAMKL